MNAMSTSVLTWPTRLKLWAAYAAALLLVEQVACGWLRRRTTPLEPRAATSRLVSALNGIVVTALASAALLLEQPPGDGPPMGALAEVSLIAMCGYIPVDSFLDWRQGDFDVKLAAHHVLGLFSMGTGLATGLGGRTLMRVLIAEGSTPLMHLSWLAIKLGWRETRAWLYKIFGYSLVLSFFVLRAAHPALILHLMWRAEVAQAYAREGWWGAPLFRVQLGVVIIWWLLNLFWFYLLLKSATGKRDKADRYDS